jgi:hypothetical protein
MSDNDLPLIPFGIDDEQLYTKEPYDFSRKKEDKFDKEKKKNG